MILRRVYPLAVVAVLVLYASFFVLSIILPSFVSVSKSAKFESSTKLNDYSHVQKNFKRELLKDKIFKNYSSSLLHERGNEFYTHRKQVTQAVSASASVTASGIASKQFLIHNNLKISTTAPSSRHVTKSLEELGYVSGRVNPDFLFFNRVPKCGSEMLVLLTQWLQGLNGFKHVRLGGGNIRRLKRLQQEDLVEEVIRNEKEALPLSFDRHVYWLNFSAFDHSTPLWINLIRDPIEKAASRFYYAKELNKRNIGYTDRYTSFEECVDSGQDINCRFINGEMYDLTIPYFCGHEKWCMALNDQWALEEAKSNVDRYYAVVGILEEINVTLAVMEKKLPRFFSGVQEMYFRELLEPRQNMNRKRPRGISTDLRRRLQSSLKLEYEFYDFIKSRLFHHFLNLNHQTNSKNAH